MALKNYLEQGTKQSSTRLQSLAIVAVGLICFIAVTAFACIHITEVDGWEIGIMLTAISALIALGVTGKYYGTKLEVQNRQNSIDAYSTQGMVVDNAGEITTYNNQPKTE